MSRRPLPQDLAAVESRLSSLARKPPPLALRDRVMDAVGRERAATHRPDNGAVDAWWLAAAAAAVVIALNLSMVVISKETSVDPPAAVPRAAAWDHIWASAPGDVK